MAKDAKILYLEPTGGGGGGGGGGMMRTLDGGGRLRPKSCLYKDPPSPDKKFPRKCGGNFERKDMGKVG